jgi:hypothetical protein
MTTIGGKTKKPKLPSQPQVVVQLAHGINQYAKIITAGEDGGESVAWIGDPNAATKFDSKYAAKSRVRDADWVPETRVFVVLQPRGA